MTVREVSDIMIKILNDESLPKECREYISSTKDCCWSLINSYDFARIVIEDEDLDELLEDLENAGYSLVSFSNDSENNGSIYSKAIKTCSTLQSLKSSGEYFVDIRNIFLNDYGDYVNENGIVYADDFTLSSEEDVDVDWYILTKYFGGINNAVLYTFPYLDPDITERFLELHLNPEDGGVLRYISDIPIYGADDGETFADEAFDEGDYNDSDCFISKLNLEDFIPYRKEYGCSYVERSFDLLPLHFREPFLLLLNRFSAIRGTVSSGCSCLFHLFIHSCGKMCLDTDEDVRVTEKLYKDELDEYTELAKEDEDYIEDVESTKRVLTSWKSVERFLKSRNMQIYFLGIGNLDKLRVLEVSPSCWTIIGSL